MEVELTPAPVDDRSPSETFDRFVFDLDGTLWRGDELLPDAERVLGELRRRSKRIAFLTNNGSRSGREVAGRLVALGIEAAADEVVTSGRAARRLLADSEMSGRRAYVVGGEGLLEELAPLELELLSTEEGEVADVVIVTRDEEFTYAKMRTAARAIARGALFVATNTDPTFPVEVGFWPGGGAIVAAIEAASGGVEPVVAGKPETPMLLEAEAAVGGGGPTILIGDRPRSDLVSARRAGWTGALVLTGVTEATSDIDPAPDLILRNLGELLPPAADGGR